MASAALGACTPATTPTAETDASGAAARQGQSATASDPAVYRGSVVARQVCVSCHDVGVTGEAPPPNSHAPSFVVLASREGATREALTRAYLEPHAEMPAFLFSEDSVADLTAYIMSLRTDG